MTEQSPKAIPREELEQLVKEWREKGSDLQLNDPDRVAEKGRGMVECANELEELIEGADDSPLHSGVVPSASQVTHSMRQGGPLKNIGGGGARPSGSISAPEAAKALLAELEQEQEPEHRWECPECGEENELDPSVVELCVEHWTTCEECGNRVAFDLAGKP